MITLDIPQIEFFNESNMLLFWGYLGMFLKVVSPALLISIALSAVGLLLLVIVRAVKKAYFDEPEDDEDYDIRHY